MFGSKVNSLEDNTLVLRTLLDQDIDNIFGNRQAVKIVTKAAINTTVDNPFLELPPEDRWPVNNLFLNYVVGAFSSDG